MFFADHVTGVDINKLETGLLARDWLSFCTYLNLALVLADRFSLTISSNGIDDDGRKHVKDGIVRIGGYVVEETCCVAWGDPRE